MNTTTIVPPAPSPSQDPGFAAPGAPGQAQPAIAAWDTVPFQKFDSGLTVGVVAFQGQTAAADDDILEVVFQVRSLTIGNIYKSRLNPATIPPPLTADALAAGCYWKYPHGVTGYWIDLHASNFVDGLVVVSATVYPRVGLPVALPPLTLYANADGTLPAGPTLYVSPTTGNDAAAGTATAPLATIDAAIKLVADGGRIELLTAGTYPMGELPGSVAVHNTQFITISPAVGLPAGAVTITGTGPQITPHIDRVKFSGVTFDFSTFVSLLSQDTTWLDGCMATMSGPVTNPNPLNPYVTAAGGTGFFVTDSISTKTVNGFIGCQLVRGCQIGFLLGDALQMSRAMMNNIVHDFYGTEVHHADVYQMWSNLSGIVLAGLVVRHGNPQVLFLQPQNTGTIGEVLSNSAFVDIDAVVNGTGGPPFSQIQPNVSNVIIRRLTTNQNLELRKNAAGWAPANLVIQASQFPVGQNLTDSPGVEFQGCSIVAVPDPGWVPPTPFP